MSNLHRSLKRFERRVRIVRAWRGFAIGACVGTVSCAVWAVLDWRNVLYTEVSWMVALALALSLLGALVGVLMRVSVGGLAASIDRRAGLEDRLTTVREREGTQDTFDEALRGDADAKLAGIQPKRVYPIKLSRWHGVALGFAVLAAAIFMLGNTPIALSEEAKHDREDLKKLGQAVERINKQNFETPDAEREMSDAEKRLADQMRRFNRDLEKAHISKEDALQKANDLAQKADDLMKDEAKDSSQSLAQADTARDQMVKSELEKGGLGNVSPQMAQMPDGERQERMDQAKREAQKMANDLEALKRKLDEINNKLANPKLSEAERKALEAQKREIEKKIEDLQKQLEANQEMQKALELSKEAQAIFNKMMQDPLFKQLMEIQKKLAQDSKSAAQSGQPKLTDAERAELKKQLEELAARLKDEKAMKAYLQSLIDAMKRANAMGRCNGIGLGLKGLQIPGSGTPPPGPGDTTPGIWQGDTGKIHKLDKPEASRGTTTTDVVNPDQRPSTGPQAYVEIRAPSTVGNRTSVPYRDVLPSYQKKAESALDRQQIPKEHQERVKKYFESLTGPKKG